jgi:hypothetical protein
MPPYVVSVRNGIGVSTDIAVWLTSGTPSHSIPHGKLGGRLVLATCFASRHDPSAYGTGTHSLAPFGTLIFMSYIHHSRHTHAVMKSCLVSARR